MQGFWDAYPPTEAMRHDLYAAPLWASDRQLTGLPPVLVTPARRMFCATKMRRTRSCCAVTGPG